ncbi:MAG TPA: hypothetical protein DCR61_14410 [Verrucomicrobiales bacterium]|nr:hypothetical protein [Verrucomicrobiales bacterium]
MTNTTYALWSEHPYSSLRIDFEVHDLVMGQPSPALSVIPAAVLISDEPLVCSKPDFSIRTGSDAREIIVGQTILSLKKLPSL